jgi:CRP-like cAMP-binding protein
MSGEQLDIELLRTFSPLDGLKQDNLAALARKVQIRELSPQQTLFKEGDTEKRTVYVVSGSLELIQDGKVGEIIKGGTDNARNPVAAVIPRRVTARARDRVQYIAIDSDLLDVMLTWDQTGSYEVAEMGDKDEGVGAGGDDWMTMLLQTKAFHKIPPANIQAIFMRMQQINYKAGDVVCYAGNATEQGWHQARGTRRRRHVRRRSPDLRRKTQRDCDHEHRWRSHAAGQG